MIIVVIIIKKMDNKFNKMVDSMEGIGSSILLPKIQSKI